MYSVFTCEIINISLVGTWTVVPVPISHYVVRSSRGENTGNN